MHNLVLHHTVTEINEVTRLRIDEGKQLSRALLAESLGQFPVFKHNHPHCAVRTGFDVTFGTGILPYSHYLIRFTNENLSPLPKSRPPFLLRHRCFN